MTIATKPLQKPNECIICNHSNDVEYWDTERYLDTPFVFPKSGRKYVCAECIASAATEFGYLTPEAATLLKDRNTYLETENEEVRLQSDLAKVIIEAAETLAAGQPGRAKTLKPPHIESTPTTSPAPEPEPDAEDDE